jgi:hypothetical protein
MRQLPSNAVDPSDDADRAEGRCRTTLRGAVAGTAAAAIWAAQQPLDQRVFQFPFDDVELLGKAVTRGPRWRAAGTALHLVNGALFGAVYANVAGHASGMPAWSRGPAAALVEHAATWPATALTDRFHPARREMPVLRPSHRALAQATWRHLLFGVVLGEFERRLCRPAPRRR